MTGSVAQDQLQSFDRHNAYMLTLHVEQLHRSVRRQDFMRLSGSPPPAVSYPDPSIDPVPPRRAPKGEGVALMDGAYWLDHCARLSGRMADFDHQTRRGYVIACKLLGLSWGAVKDAIGAARTSGADRAAEVWAPYMSAPAEKYLGFVYVARHAKDRGERKIGFSTNLKKRMAALSRQEGEAVFTVYAKPGTMLIEWALHADMGPTVPGKAEWYEHDAIPVWLKRGEAA